VSELRENSFQHLQVFLAYPEISNPHAIRAGVSGLALSDQAIKAHLRYKLFSAIFFIWAAGFADLSLVILLSYPDCSVLALAAHEQHKRTTSQAH
jgi:hypothetical protein